MIAPPTMSPTRIFKLSMSTTLSGVFLQSRSDAAFDATKPIQRINPRNAPSSILIGPVIDMMNARMPKDMIVKIK